MAKKPQETKKSQDETIIKRVDNVTDFWSTFSKEMEEKLGNLFEKSTEDYRDIYKSWTALSESMGKQMMNTAMGDETPWKNMYHSWKELSEQMNTNIGKMPKMDDKMHDDFLSYWSEYSEQFNDQLSKLMLDGFKEQMELYDLWMDAFAKGADERSKTGDITSIVNKYWIEAFGKFHDFYSERSSGSDLKPGQTRSGEQMVKEYEDLYKNWLDSSQKMLDEIMRSPTFGTSLARSVSSSMDARKTFENMFVQNLKGMGIPTRTELEEIRTELKNITDRLDSLDKTLKSLSK
jgi:hypothetical protein